jgi:hypothetical protein
MIVDAKSYLESKNKSKNKNCKEATKNITVAISEKLHAKISLYNKLSDRVLNMTRICERALNHESKKIDEEMTQMLKDKITELGEPLHIKEYKESFELLCKYIVEEIIYPSCYEDHMRIYAAYIYVHETSYVDLYYEDIVKHSENTAFLYNKVPNNCDELITCLPLYPITKCKFEENKIIFYIDDVICRIITPISNREDGVFCVEDYLQEEVINIKKYNALVERIKTDQHESGNEY